VLAGSEGLKVTAALEPQWSESGKFNSQSPDGRIGQEYSRVSSSRQMWLVV
jgi:hypothetical protein